MKNKIITIYELLGLIKDGKAPYEVIYQGAKYHIYKLENCYRAEDTTPLFMRIFSNYNDYDSLQETVEILPEENDDWEDIEEIKNLDFGGDCKYRYTSDNGTSYEIPKEIVDTLKSLIKNQQKIIEKLEDNTCIKTKTELCNLIDEKIQKKLDKNNCSFKSDKEIFKQYIDEMLEKK